jgi:hypothetical protein
MLCYCSGLIEKNTWAGLEDFYMHLQRAVLEEGTHLPIAKKKTRRRRRLLSVCPSGSDEPKHRISRPVSSKWDSSGETSLLSTCQLFCPADHT